MTTTLLRGNALALPLAAGTVDLVVTSPPYFGLRSYTDGGEHYAGQIGSEPTPAEFLDALTAATAEMVRVLKPGGSIFVNLGDKYAGSPSGPRKTGPAKGRKFSTATFTTRVRREPNVPAKSLMGLPWRYALRCIDDLGLILRAEIIWSKPNGLPESVTDRVRRSHEQWFHFTREPRYYAAVDEIRQPYAAKTFTVTTSPRRSDEGSAGDKRNKWHEDNGITRAEMINPLGALPGSVWDIATQPLKVPAELGVDHFAAFPMEWPRRIIRGWSPEASIVLDPFGGTGTVAMVASALGRHGVSVDMSADYCRLARWRTNDPTERAKAAQVEKPPAQPTDMDALW